MNLGYLDGLYTRLAETLDGEWAHAVHAGVDRTRLAFMTTEPRAPLRVDVVMAVCGAADLQAAAAMNPHDRCSNFTIA